MAIKKNKNQPMGQGFSGTLVDCDIKCHASAVAMITHIKLNVWDATVREKA